MSGLLDRIRAFMKHERAAEAKEGYERMTGQLESAGEVNRAGRVVAMDAALTPDLMTQHDEEVLGLEPDSSEPID